ncbi:hypothetical protein TNCV_4696851 [Trichonephila clavipes]|nr:hypothetical protein TNCV_4696851 [Trichonephila clavipes]
MLRVQEKDGTKPRYSFGHGHEHVEGIAEPQIRILMSLKIHRAEPRNPSREFEVGVVSIKSGFRMRVQLKIHRVEGLMQF